MVRRYRASGTRGVSRSTGPNEPLGLFTREAVRGTMATVSVTGPTGCDSRFPPSPTPERPVPPPAAHFFGLTFSGSLFPVSEGWRNRSGAVVGSEMGPAARGVVWLLEGVPPPIDM